MLYIQHNSPVYGVRINIIEQLNHYACLLCKNWNLNFYLKFLGV